MISGWSKKDIRTINREIWTTLNETKDADNVFRHKLSNGLDVEQACFIWLMYKNEANRKHVEKHRSNNHSAPIEAQTACQSDTKMSDSLPTA